MKSWTEYEIKSYGGRVIYPANSLWEAEQVLPKIKKYDPTAQIFGRSVHADAWLPLLYYQESA